MGPQRTGSSQVADPLAADKGHQAAPQAGASISERGYVRVDGRAVPPVPSERAEAVWLSADDVVDGNFPPVCCLSGEQATEMHPVSFRPASHWYRGADVGGMVGFHLGSTGSRVLRGFLPASEAALHKRRSAERWRIRLAIAAVPLVLVGLLMMQSTALGVMVSGAVAVMLALVAMAGAVVLVVLLLMGYGRPRGTLHVEKDGQLKVWLENPHPGFVAALRKAYSESSTS